MLHVHRIYLFVEKTLGRVTEEQDEEFLRPDDVVFDLLGGTRLHMKGTVTFEWCRLHTFRPPHHREDDNCSTPFDEG